MPRFFNTPTTALTLPTGEVKGSTNKPYTVAEKHKSPDTGYDAEKHRKKMKKEHDANMGEYGGNDGYNYNGAYGTDYGE